MKAPFQRHSMTSLAAAEIAPTAWLGKVLATLVEAGPRGMTDEEQQARLNLNPSTQRPRRVELVSRGLVVGSGRKRPTLSGRKAVVWISTEYKEKPIAFGQLELVV